MLKDIILDYIAGNLGQLFKEIDAGFFENIREIRLRSNKPVVIAHKDGEFFLDRSGYITKYIENAVSASPENISKTLELVSNYSLYAFSEEIKNGYITIAGGHRIGMTGKAVVEKGSVKAIKNFNSLNIRISHEIKGCAESVAGNILDRESIYHTMIISPPCCGKTTLLRDLIRILSDGFSFNGNHFLGQAIGVVDERSEIAGCYLGIPQKDIGSRTDVLDSCPKAEGMLMLLRAMSPKIIAVDEIGKDEDVYAIESVLNSGVKLLCTVHASNIDDILKKPALNHLIDKKVFKRFIVLKGCGVIQGIYDEEGEPV